jgi:type VI secretion system protein ImpF
MLSGKTNMAGPGKKDRLSPPLMYAFRGAHAARDAKQRLDLRDEAGDRVIASRRSTARGAITEPLLRREVASDLSALMNTVALESCIALDAHGYVRRSVLNFGFPDLVHRSIDELSTNDIGAELRQVLARFEPRLAPDSIEVTRDPNVDKGELKIRFLVSAELSCEPLNVPVEFIADVEFDSGKIMINRL